MKNHLVACMLGAALGVSGTRLSAAERQLPLPDAPVRFVIPDASAFDTALSGAFRRAAAGELDTKDPLVSSWRQSPVGSKLEAEWTKLAADLPWTWTEIRRLQPRALGLALLSAGALEAVLVVDTPLATLPITLPDGTPKTHAGVAYTLIASGAGDPEGSDERRIGLAWARHHGLLIVATSERALLLAIDEAVAGRGVSAFLPGLASLELDLARLRDDRYFVREFVFGLGPEEGRMRAALRIEDGRLVEVREGRGPRLDGAFSFDARVAAAGWEPGAEGFLSALRAGLLEPVPNPSGRPVPPLTPLPAGGEASDHYLVRLDRPLREAQAPWGEGDVATWREIATRRPAPGWGWALDADGGRAVVFAWPQARQAEIEGTCRETLTRRAGPVMTTKVGDAIEMRVGPGLPTLALRRTGDFVWIGTSVGMIAGLVAPRPAGDVVRWARVDLTAVRAEGERWARAEGPAAPERVRPFSDRVLGLLGWIPSVRSLEIERTQTTSGWTERVVFETR